MKLIHFKCTFSGFPVDSELCNHPQSNFGTSYKESLDSFSISPCCTPIPGPGFSFAFLI